MAAMIEVAPPPPRTPLDAELDAMRVIATALEPFELEAAGRILAWIGSWTVRNCGHSPPLPDWLDERHDEPPF